MPERTLPRASAPASAPFSCAECGTATAPQYVVSGALDDREGRTEVCVPCWEAVR